MIPLRLELTNFLSYRQTAVLDFDHIHLACISGPNGAGKSSILDGITWALFGQSRSKSDDDVVNRVAALEGQGAEIRFTFELEGSIYRLTRRKTPRKTAWLELQMAAGVDEAGQPERWKSLSEGKIRETQAAIEKLLRMNYDTFINASFLLQGKADEFTLRSPNQRKEILADLLGVSRWDQYREAAATQRRAEEGRLGLLDAQTAEIAQELEQEPERQAALAAAKESLHIITGRLNDKEQLLAQLRRVETAVQQQKQMVDNLAQNLARARHTLSGWQQTQQQRQSELDQYQTILADSDRITADWVAWQAADKESQAWQEKADAYNRLQQLKRPHELALTQTQSRLEQQQQALEAQAARVASARQEQQTGAAQRDEGRAQLENVTRQLASLAAQEAAWHAARETLQQMESERRLLSQEQNQLLAQEKRIQSWQQEQTAVQANAQEAEAMLANLTTQIAVLGEQHQRFAVARAEMDTLRSQQSSLRQQMDELKERMDRLGAESGGSCPLCGQTLTAEHRQTVLAELQAEGQKLGQQFRANKQQLADLAHEVEQLEKTLQQSPRLERDQQAQQQRLAKAEARLAEIQPAVAEWVAEGAVRLAALTRQLADDSAIREQQAKVNELATAVQEKAHLEQAQQQWQQQVAAAEARLAEIERALAEWADVGQAALAEVQQKLETGQYATEARTALADLEQQIGALGYDLAAHEAARQTRQALAQAPARRQALKEAEAAVKPLKVNLADLAAQIAAQEEIIAELTSQRQTAVAELDRLIAEGSDRQVIEDEVFRLREEQVLANRQVGAAQQRLDVLDDLRQRQKQQEKERQALTQRIQRLKLLEKACGRDGVQALLIEQALPEIEERANELLERLTGGDMRVSFETQRALKSREGLAETLDIHISDSAGERPYDNYSGGEQFRVNFAIRLALSQLLARRAGARLQTLVIDEGFGSQDPNGRQRLVEAINSIQGDFARILIITHIDELRDAFPTRIEVEKGALGSTIREL